MIINRNGKTYKITPQELFQAYEEQKLLFLLESVQDLFRDYPEFRRMSFLEKQKAVKTVAKSAAGMITAKGYNNDTAIILSIEKYLRGAGQYV